MIFSSLFHGGELRLELGAGLLRTPTSSTFWIFEALVPVPKVADEQESQDENKESGNPGL